jgi:enterochelin esterase-like enzyme
MLPQSARLKEMDVQYKPTTNVRHGKHVSSLCPKHTSRMVAHKYMPYVEKSLNTQKISTDLGRGTHKHSIMDHIFILFFVP